MTTITRSELIESNSVFTTELDLFPWITLKEYMLWEKMTVKELAEKVWYTPIFMYQVLAWTRSIKIPLAIKLQEEFGATAMFWLNLQRSYDFNKYINANYK